MNFLRRFDAWLWSDAGGGVTSAVLLVALVIILIALTVAPLMAR